MMLVHEQVGNTVIRAVNTTHSPNNKIDGTNKSWTLAAQTVFAPFQPQEGCLFQEEQSKFIPRQFGSATVPYACGL